MKKLNPLFLLCVFFLLLVCACSRGGGDKDVLRVAIPAGPVALDPRIAADAMGDKIGALLCDGLLKKDDRLEMTPALAESYEQISDTSYRFLLRRDVVFHDGTPLTAGDVVYTYRSIIDGIVKSPYRNAFERIKEVALEGDYVIRIDLKGPYAPFLVSLNRGIVSEKAATEMGDAFATHPICAGPYRLVRYTPDSLVLLEANTNYYDVKPKVPRLEFQIITDDNIRVLKLIKGDIDLVQNDIPPMLLEGVLKSQGLAKQEDTGIVVAYMGFNLTDRLLAKKVVRQAIAYAINRDEMITHRWKGLAVKANSILSPDNWAYDHRLRQYPYDPARAAKLLDSAGLKDPDGDGPAKRFEISLKTSTKKDRVDNALMMAHQLEKVGIGVKVEPYEWGTFFKDVRTGNFQTYTLTWVGVIEPDIFYDICSSTQTPPDGLNRGRYKNHEIDRLVTEGRIAMDRGARRAIYARVQEILLDDLPFVPLWYEKNVVVYNRSLKGVRLRPDASFATFADIEKN